MINKVFIFQESMPEYRFDFYDKLASALGSEYEVSLYCINSNPNYTGPVKQIEHKVSKFKSLRYVHEMNKAAKEADIVILLFDIQWLNIWSLQLLCRKKLIMWGHGFGRQKIARLPRLLFMHFCKTLMVYEEHTVHELVEAGVNPDKVFYAGNTIGVKNPKLSWEPEKRKNFLYVGRLQKRKLVDKLLVDFAAIAKDLSSGSKLLIVGDGEEKEALIRQADSLGIASQVEFKGACFDENELKGYFEQSLLYVCPGLLGLGVLHAFAYGVPVASYHRFGHGPEVHNIEQGENGFLVNPDKESLSEIMLQADRCPDDFKLMGEKAYNYYHGSRTMKHMAQRFLEAIDHVCST